MRTLLRIDEFLEQWIVRIGQAAAWVSIGLIFVIVFDVVTHRFFVLGSTKLQDLEWHFHAVLFLSCLGFGYIRNTHVRIDLVRERLNKRTQLWIELIGCLVFLIPYALIIIFFGVDWWHRSFLQNEMSESATGLPYRWIIKAALPFGFLILLLSAVVVAFRKFMLLFAPPEFRKLIEEREYLATLPLDQPEFTDFFGSKQ